MTENHTQLPPGDYTVPTTFAEIPAELREHIEHREDFGLVAEEPVGPKRSFHAGCTHPDTKRDRAECRKTKKREAVEEFDQAVDKAGPEKARLVAQAYKSLPDRYVMSMAAAADSPFPYTDGDVTVLGPEVFHDEAAMVISYKGQNYVRQDEAASRGNDLLRTVFASQERFQTLLGHVYDEMETPERVNYLKDQILALLDEAHEALNEIGWKPWASSRHINHKEFGGELVDILCFLVNLALGVGLSADEFFALHQEKVQRNIKRQEKGYDGVQGKCPGCNRAIDDLRAKGLPVGTFGGVDYCSPECIEKVNGPRPSLVHGTDVPFHDTQES